MLVERVASESDRFNGESADAGLFKLDSCGTCYSLSRECPITPPTSSPELLNEFLDLILESAWIAPSTRLQKTKKNNTVHIRRAYMDYFHLFFFENRWIFFRISLSGDRQHARMPQHWQFIWAQKIAGRPGARTSKHRWEAEITIHVPAECQVTGLRARLSLCVMRFCCPAMSCLANSVSIINNIAPNSSVIAHSESSNNCCMWLSRRESRPPTAWTSSGS